MEEIINSVMQSPENTNPNVLRSQLQNIGGGSGDGDPNTQQTIIGTMANPWGDVSYSELAAALHNGNAHANIGNTAEYFPLLSNNGSSIYTSKASIGATIADFTAAEIKWNDNGSVKYLRLIEDDQYQDYTAYAAEIQTILTIYWHPMP